MDSTRGRKLDVFAPKHGRAKAVVVFLYGGGWTSGDRRIYKFLGTALARRGSSTVVPDYRVYPGVRYPAFVEDGAAAIKWTNDNVTRLRRQACRTSS
jgi:acetyl esterase/lipase